MVKGLLLAALCGAACMVQAQTLETVPNTEVDADSFYVNGGFMGMAISPNGRYVCGSTGAYQGFIYDTTEKKYVQIDPIDDEGCEYRQVSNTGVAIGFNGPATQCNVHTGVESVVWANTETYATLGEALSADGEYLIGEIANYDMTSDNSWQTKGVVWHNGEMTILPCPTTEEMGFEISGTKARFINADGTVIVGSVIDNFSTYPVIAWDRQEDGTWALDTICKGKYCDDSWTGKGPYFAMVPGGVSPNGRYISLGVEEYLGDMTMEDGTTMPQQAARIARLDRTTGEIKTFPYQAYTTQGWDDTPVFTDVACEANGVADNGTIIGYTGGMTSRSGVIVIAGDDEKVQPLTEAFPDVEEFGAYEMRGINLPISISADGNRFMGYGVSEKGYETYIVTIAPDQYDAIESVKTTTTAPTRYYTLDGREVAQPTRGLYIVGGKKVVIK